MATVNEYPDTVWPPDPWCSRDFWSALYKNRITVFISAWIEFMSASSTSDSLPLPLNDYRRYGRQMIIDGLGLPGVPSTLNLRLLCSWTWISGSVHYIHLYLTLTVDMELHNCNQRKLSWEMLVCLLWELVVSDVPLSNIFVHRVLVRSIQNPLLKFSTFSLQFHFFNMHFR